MYLLIDMSVQDIIVLKLCSKNQQKSIKKEGRNRELLEFIDIFLLQEKKKKEDIEGIAVVAGIGSFTSVRIATVVANVFAYIKNIPVITIDDSEKTNNIRIIEKIEKQKDAVYISAKYSSEPNIGKKKNVN
jgi:tRNA A37 threonylcarbamoyladenosine modification protein TsaB